jgi:biotin carboxylase
MGHTVVAIDRDPEAVGVKYADHFEHVDVTDREGAISVARKYGIHGVLTLQTDLPVPTVGAVVDALNLKGVSEEVANRCSNKIQTRMLFREKGIPQPDFAVVKSEAEARAAMESIGLPCVIKSPDSSGSRGVTKINRASELPHALGEAFTYARSKDILVEEFIEGIEAGASGFSVGDECVKVLVHNDTVSDPPYMIPTGHSFPVMMNAGEEERVKTAAKKAVEALGIKDGPSNIDLIIDGQNNAKIIEIGARVGATCLPELVEHYCGVDWVKQAINICLGFEVDLAEKYHIPVHAEIVQSPCDGILKDYTIPDALKNHPQILEYEVTANPGEEVSRLRKGTDRIGKVIVKGDHVEGLEQLARELRDSIVLNIEETKT